MKQFTLKASVERKLNLKIASCKHSDQSKIPLITTVPLKKLPQKWSKTDLFEQTLLNRPHTPFYTDIKYNISLSLYKIAFKPKWQSNSAHRVFWGLPNLKIHIINHRALPYKLCAWPPLVPHQTIIDIYSVHRSSTSPSVMRSDTDECICKTWGMVLGCSGEWSQPTE